MGWAGIGAENLTREDLYITIPYFPFSIFIDLFKVAQSFFCVRETLCHSIVEKIK